MKPLFLEMSAFGAFGGLEQIDFNAISSGVFLIFGETGAGKTTVFDAISYALYGEMSGSVRETKSVRSDFADEGIITYVRLEFQYRGKRYEIYRRPPYERKKLKGSGTTVERGKVELSLPDGGILSDDTSVKLKITELLGLNCAQWKQVAMIAQGEFMKSLHAPGEQRSALFRNIFRTDYYARLSARLREQELCAKKKYEALLDSLLQYANGAVLTCSDELCRKFNAALINRTPEGLEEMELLLKQIVGFNNSRDAKLSEEYELLQKRLIEINSEMESAKMMNARILELEYENRVKEKLMNLSGEIEKEKSFIQKAEDVFDEVKLLIEQLKKHDEAQLSKDKISNISYQLSLKCKVLEKKISEKEKLRAELEENEKCLQKNRDARLSINIHINELERLETAIAGLNAILKDAGRYCALRDEYIALKNFYDDKEKKRKIAETVFSDKSDAFIKGQAWILAESLSDNTACPVCGSLNHPRKAMKTHGVPSETELKKLEKVVSAAVAEARAAEVKLSEKRIEGIETKKCIIKEAGNCLEIADSDYSVENITEKIRIKLGEIEKRRDMLTDKTNELNKDLHELEKAEKAQEGIAASIERHTISENEFANEINQLRILLSSIEGEYAEKVKGLIHPAKDGAVERLRHIACELELSSSCDVDNIQSIVSKRMSEARNRINDYKNMLIESSSKISMLEKYINTKTAINISELEERSISIKKEGELMAAEKADNLAAYKSNERLLNKITDGIAELKEEEEKYLVIERLSKTANGELKGKRKLTLEMYVQRAYFHKILLTANIRLKKMTGGQFELLRKRLPDNLKDKSFALDLDVLDNYTGKIRDINSLSGGETFMAALALALALSDIIQMEAGGVEINTMFIDEGFGSLSQEYLRRVVETLSAMSDEDDESGKMIGVISHVDSLKDSIRKQILVEKTGIGGSKTKIFIN